MYTEYCVCSQSGFKLPPKTRECAGPAQVLQASHTTDGTGGAGRVHPRLGAHDRGAGEEDRHRQRGAVQHTQSVGHRLDSSLYISLYHIPVCLLFD